MTITEKTAYLKGLLEGLGLDKQSSEGKLFAAIVDALDEIAQNVADLDEEVCAINDEMDMMEESLDAIDEALDDLEDALDAIDEDLDDMDDELEEIFEILKNAGFACSNVTLGVGSFSMHCIEEDNMLKPFTRDTFSSCIKACYAEVGGKCYPVFKNPKDGGFKKSQKGLCFVYEEDGVLKYKDEYTNLISAHIGRHISQLDSLINRESRDLTRSILLELIIPELHAFDRLIRRHLGIKSLHLILEILLSIVYSHVGKKVRIREDFRNDSDLVFLHAALSRVNDHLIHTLDLLKISLNLLRIDILSV